MSLEISEPISHAVDIVLLTFMIVWRERQTEKSKDINTMYGICPQPLPMPGLPAED